MRNALDSVTLAAVAAFVAVTAGFYSRVPERIPTHFGIDGRPDAWSDRSLLAWMMLPILSVAILVGFRWLGDWIARNPKGMNFPGIEKVRALPERFREPVSEVSRDLMSALTLEVTAVFALAQYATWLAAHGRDSETVIFAVLGVSVLGSPVLLAWFFSRMSAAIRESLRRAEAGGWRGGEAPAAED